MSIFKSMVLTLLLTNLAACYAEPKSEAQTPTSTLTSFPTEISADCRDGKAKIYDECGDQLALYETALATAIEEDKILIVSYGAEWCIWCHVFEKYIRGEHSSFTHTYSGPADDERYTSTLHERETHDVSVEAGELAAFVADHFILVHLEYKYSTGSDEALITSGAMSVYDNSLPFIYTVSHDGRFAAKLDTNAVETRRDTEDWFRGYNRNQLRGELSRLETVARQIAP